MSDASIIPDGTDTVIVLGSKVIAAYLGAANLPVRVVEPLPGQLADAIADASGRVHVLMPLMSADFDALHALQALVALGYRGSVGVTSTALPAPGMVLAELRGSANGITVDLLVLPMAADPPDHHSH